MINTNKQLWLISHLHSCCLSRPWERRRAWSRNQHPHSSRREACLSSQTPAVRTWIQKQAGCTPPVCPHCCPSASYMLSVSLNTHRYLNLLQAHQSHFPLKGFKCFILGEKKKPVPAACTHARTRMDARMHAHMHLKNELHGALLPYNFTNHIFIDLIIISKILCFM